MSTIAGGLCEQQICESSEICDDRTGTEIVSEEQLSLFNYQIRHSYDFAVEKNVL